MNDPENHLAKEKRDDSVINSLRASTPGAATVIVIEVTSVAVNHRLGGSGGRLSNPPSFLPGLLKRPALRHFLQVVTPSSTTMLFQSRPPIAVQRRLPTLEIPMVRKGMIHSWVLRDQIRRGQCQLVGLPLRVQRLTHFLRAAVDRWGCLGHDA